MHSERASVGIFYQLLSNFAKTHKIGTTGVEMGFVQKVEKREMAITAGVSGSVGTSEGMPFYSISLRLQLIRCILRRQAIERTLSTKESGFISGRRKETL